MRFGVHSCIIMVLVSALILTVSAQSHRKPFNQAQAQAQARLLARRQADYDILKALSPPRHATPSGQLHTQRQKDMEAAMDRLMHVILKPAVFVKGSQTGF